MDKNSKDGEAFPGGQEGERPATDTASGQRGTPPAAGTAAAPLLRHEAGERPAPNRRPLLALLLLLAAAIVGLTVTAVLHTAASHKDTEIARLQAVADIKARQITDWLKERQEEADFLLHSRYWAKIYRSWRQDGDTRSRSMLLERLGEFRSQDSFRDVILLDEAGQPLWNATNEPMDLEAGLGAFARRPEAQGKVSQFGPYQDADGHLHLDLVAPLPPLSGRAGPIVVLRADPAGYLHSTLQAWPIPDTSGETLLFRRDGDQVLYLNELRHRSDTVAKLRFSITEPTLLASRVLRGEVTADGLVVGTDYRGVPALGVVRPISGTDWFLVAKLDQAEMDMGAAGQAWWIILAGFLALSVTGTGLFLFHLRQQLGAALRERETQAEKLRALQLLDSIVGNSSDAIFVKDAEGRYLLLNPAAARLVGKSEAEVLGQDDTAIFPPADAAHLAAADRRVMADNQVVSLEEEVTRGQETRTFLSIKGPVRDTAGRVVGVFGMARDITQRKRTEDQLRKLSLAVEQSPASIIFTDLDANIEYVNEAFVRNTGYGCDEVMGRKTSLLKSGRTPPATHAALWDALGKGQPWQGELCNRRRDGSEYVDFAIIAPIRQPDGRITHYVSVQEDITEKRRLAEELEKHRHHLEDLVAQRTEELQTVLEAIPTPVFIARDRQCRHITGNRAGNEVFSVRDGDNVSFSVAAAERAIDYQVFDTAGRPLPPEELAMQRAAAEGRAVGAAEYRLQFADGRHIWLYGDATPLFDRDGAVRGAVAAFADITEHKKWEQILAIEVASRTRELQESNRALRAEAEVRRRTEAELRRSNTELEQIAYITSHDLQEPLRTVASFVQLLARRNRGRLDEESEQFMRFAVEGVFRMQAIIRDILDFSRVGGAPDPQAPPADTSAAFAEALNNLGEAIAAADARVACDPLPPVAADPRQLVQLFQNLIGNGLKFRAAEPPCIQVSVAPEKENWRFRVRDNGIGIDPRYHDKIFVIFQRLHSRADYPGTGIGLALCKKIVERHGGRIWVESEPGQGASFHFTLPGAGPDAPLPRRAPQKRLE